MVNSTRLGCAALLVALFPWAVVVAQPPKPAPAAGNRTAKSRPAAGTPAAKPSPSPAAKPSPSPAAPAPPVATPTPAEALQLQPLQKQIDYDVPDAQATEKCTVSSIKAPPVSGWEVRSGQGDMLRRFLDTDGDNKIDQWCYFKDGVEVYRDIDSDFNRKVDQYRWLGTAGIRWAVDTNEDGNIDGWKAISPEEISEEIIVALGTRDAARFGRLLLTEEELRALRLGPQQATELGKKIADTQAELEEFVRSQSFVKPESRWVNFGATRPGVVPAGTDNSEQDVEVYENAVAVIESDSGHDQIILGTLIRVGEAWRIIGLPRSISDTQASLASDGFFFRGPLSQRGTGDVPVAGGLSPELQELINQLEQIDRDLTAAETPEASAPLNAQRADLLEKLAATVTTAEDKAMWITQLADTVSAAVQAGGYPNGIARLEALGRRLESEQAAPHLVSYVKFRFLSADYAYSQATDKDYAAVQKKWMADLEQFVTDFPTSRVASDAMLSLAAALEFANEDEKAINWYTRIATEFPDAPGAVKAVGAKRRMESVGKPLDLQGQDTQGNPVSVASFRGKVVVIHYWATWCVQCKQDISVLKDMQAKYGKDNVAMIGVNVNDSKDDFTAYLTENPMPWPQLYEPGGLDNSLANALGVQTLPTMLLVDKEGKVVSRNLHGEEIDASLRKLLR